MCLQQHSLQGCFVPMTLLGIGRESLLWNSLYPVYIPTKIFCRDVPGFETDCPCGVWCRGLHSSPFCLSISYKSFLNNLVCKFNTMGIFFFTMWIHILIILVDIYCHLSISICFYFYLWNSFCVDFDTLYFHFPKTRCWCLLCPVDTHGHDGLK